MTDETPPDSLIPYDDYVQDALRGVVYNTLINCASEGGLPGNHHFYIAFKTRAEGVDIPAHLMERYPDEMTIVVQHRYWDLKVDREGFEIGLSFNQVPAKLVIPLAAVVGFVDPSVNFALQFPPPELPEPKPALKSVSDKADEQKAGEDKVTPLKAAAEGKAGDGNAGGGGDDKPDGDAPKKDNVVSVDFGKK
ncbi:MAG: ClpXP protease specificity-enhancing factor SspB [Pacificimonas sp.]